MAIRANEGRPPALRDESAEAKWRIIAGILLVLKYALKLLLACCIVAVAWVAILSEVKMPGLALFLEWGTVCGLFYSIVSTLSFLFAQASQKGTCFIDTCIVALRRISVLFLLLFFAGFIFSLWVSALSETGFRGLTLSLPLAGFPDNSSWNIAVHGSSYAVASGLVSLDISPLIVSLVLWGLASAFQYGLYLQEERDSVV